MMPTLMVSCATAGAAASRVAVAPRIPSSALRIVSPPKRFVVAEILAHEYRRGRILVAFAAGLTINDGRRPAALAREAHRQAADRLERIGELGLVRLDDGGWDDRAGDDDIAGAQP